MFNGHLDSYSNRGCLACVPSLRLFLRKIVRKILNPLYFRQFSSKSFYNLSIESIWPILARNCWRERRPSYVTWPTLAWTIFNNFLLIFFLFYVLIFFFIFPSLFFPLYWPSSGLVDGRQRSLTWGEGRPRRPLAKGGPRPSPAINNAQGWSAEGKRKRRKGKIKKRNKIKKY